MTYMHEPRPDGRCKHCGTHRTYYEENPEHWPCMPHGTTQVSSPEPALREYAVNSIDIIYAGIVRLREERDAARNYVEGK